MMKLQHTCGHVFSVGDGSGKNEALPLQCPSPSCHERNNASFSILSIARLDKEGVRLRTEFVCAGRKEGGF